MPDIDRRPEHLQTIFIATYEVAGGESLTLGVFDNEAEAEACCISAKRRLNTKEYPGRYGGAMVSFDVTPFAIGTRISLHHHPHFTRDDEVRDAPHPG